MCPRVPSSWAALATSLTVAKVLDTVCGQMVEVMVYMAVGVQNRAPGGNLEKLSGEQRS